jgi:SAM-dependent methyltransferase
VDLNTWNASQEYDAILANQILHHVLDLEHLFVEIKRSLKRGGSFVISDMIGRNGHQRWPEALATVREFWRKLPPSYRFSQRRLRYEETYEDHDCSGESFEGIRAQDILPLLLEHFHFELFIAFANLIDPFVDRDFGSNFDAAAWWDRRFIDQVNERDEKEIASGHIKPTHLLAVIGTDSSVPTLFHEPLSPRFCLRDPSAPAAVRKDEPAADDAANPWPHSDRTELEIACRRLKEAQDRIDWAARKAEDLHRELNERTAWAQRLDQEVLSCARKIEGLHQELEERTAWARQLDREVLSCARIIEGLYQELANRTAWARQLDQEVLSCARIIEGLYQELANRTAWAQRLDRELEERTPAHRKDLERLAWALAVDRRLHRPLDWAYRLVRRAVPGVVGGKAHAPAATLTP